MHDFWRASGYHLLNRTGEGRLAVTDAFLRAYFMRPELAPVAESCAAERTLHAALVDAPSGEVPAARLAEIADADARENYEVVLAFRDRLVAAGTLESAYMAIVGDPAARVPPLFLDQLVHAILRGILDGADDPMRARAGECLFRTQTVTIRDGAIMAADQETVEMYATTGGFGSLGRLVVESQTPTRSIDLDVLTDDNAAVYWGRDERYDTVLDLSFAHPGLDALCRVLESWIAHFLDVRVSIQPVREISDERWVWHVGLDAEATALLNDLYNGLEIGEERLERLLSLFRLEFRDPAVMRPDIAGRPVYLALAMAANKTVRLKPQNLLVNLPLAEAA